MKTLLLCFSVALLLCSGCAASRIEKPYIKETTTSRDGTITVRETTADSITGGTLDALRKQSPK